MTQTICPKRDGFLLAGDDFVVKDVKMINMMRTMRLKRKLNLEDLHATHGGKLYPGRPEMLLLPMSNGRRVQLFRGGTIQILGAIPQNDAEKMRREILQRLCLSMETPLVISNMVVTAQLPNLNLQVIHSSNSDIFFEAELFPAALIRKWEPAHVALFHNGKLVITGIKSLEQCQDILHAIHSHFSTL